MGGKSTDDSMRVVNPSEFKWKPKESLPPGASSATVHGDPTAGEYAFIARFPAGFTVPTHWHTNDVAVVLMKGSMTIRRTGQPNVAIREGGFLFLAGGMRYVAHTPGECIFLAYGSKPFDIFYANPKDDPRTGPANRP